jgi:hypothetical protein
MPLVDLDNIQRLLNSFYSKIGKEFAPKNHGTHLSLGTTSSTACRGDYGYTAYTHSQTAHAPSNAQKNSDITKAEIEAKLTGSITSHTHYSLPTRGDITCETGATRPSIGGLSLSAVYNNGYPTMYGNVLSIKGQGDGQILIGWSGSSGSHAPSYIRSKRDKDDANWSNWAQIYTSAFPPDANAVGAIKAISKNGYWGMGYPDGNEKEWIRTTENGIIPYQGGGYSSLGTNTWPFSDLWTNKINGVNTTNFFNTGHNVIDVAHRSYGDFGFGDSQRSCGYIGRFTGWSSDCLYINTYNNYGTESQSYKTVKIKGESVYLDGHICINGTPVSVQSSYPGCGGVWIQI